MIIIVITACVWSISGLCFWWLSLYRLSSVAKISLKCDAPFALLMLVIAILIGPIFYPVLTPKKAFIENAKRRQEEAQRSYEQYLQHKKEREHVMGLMEKARLGTRQV